MKSLRQAFSPTEALSMYPRRFLPNLESASLVAQLVKNLPAIQETWAQFLGWEDLEKEVATHSSILSWEIPWTEEPDGLQSMGSQRVGHDLVTERESGLLYPICRQVSPFYSMVSLFLHSQFF